MLYAYYEDAVAGVPNASRRFHHFCLAARPAIPCRRISDSPLTVELGPDAQSSIYESLRRVSIAFFERERDRDKKTGSADTKAILETRSAIFAKLTEPGHRTPILDRIATEFTEFLRTGLANGTAPWGTTP